MNQSVSRILMGVIHSAHGIKGQVKIKIFSASPDAFGGYNSFTDKEGKTSFIFKNCHFFKDDIVVATLTGVLDRNQAEGLKGTELYISRDQLPPAEEEEYYYQDLFNLKVQSSTGDLVGIVASVYNFGSGDLIEINLSDSREIVVLPFTKEAIPKICIAEGYLTVNEELLMQWRVPKKDEKNL